jgi:sugar phosphate isomerase/epimerase
MNFAIMGNFMNENAKNWKFNIEKECQFTRELGLNAIDIIGLGLFVHSAKEMRRIADSYGVKIICYTFFDADFNFPDISLRRAGFEKFREGLEIANQLGTDKIMLPFEEKAGFTREQSRRNVIEGLKHVVPLAKAADITVTVESFDQIDSPFIVSSDFDEALAEVPDLYITFDSGNTVFGDENPCEVFIHLKDYIVHTHFKNRVLSPKGTKGLNDKYYKSVLVDEGLIDFSELISVMQNCEYSGYIDLELFAEGYTNEQATRKSLERLKDIIGKDIKLLELNN